MFTLGLFTFLCLLAYQKSGCWAAILGVSFCCEREQEGKGDPLEKYCGDNPEADECRCACSTWRTFCLLNTWSCVWPLFSSWHVLLSPRSERASVWCATCW